MASQLLLVTACGMVLFILAFYQLRRIQEEMATMKDDRAQYIERRDLPSVGAYLRRRLAPTEPGAGPVGATRTPSVTADAGQEAGDAFGMGSRGKVALEGPAEEPGGEEEQGAG